MLATMASASFTFVEDPENPGGHFMFHDTEGREHVVKAGQVFKTENPDLVAFLDDSPFVKRAGKEKSE